MTATFIYILLSGAVGLFLGMFIELIAEVKYIQELEQENRDLKDQLSQITPEPDDYPITIEHITEDYFKKF